MQERFLDAELGAGPGSRFFSFAPVVSVVRDAHDNFLRGDDFANLAEILDKPVLRGDRAWRRSEPVLVVIHEDDGVALFAKEFVIVNVVARWQRDHEFETSGVQRGGKLGGELAEVGLPS